MTNTIVTCLGFVASIRYIDAKGDEYELTFKPKYNWSTSSKDSFLMVAESEHVITVCPWNATKTAAPKRATKAAAIYCDWSGYDTTEAYKIDIPRSVPYLIGHILRIEYTSDKFDRRGDRPGKFQLYRHNFTNQKTKLYSNRAETIFTIKSKRKLLDYRGIIA